MVKTRTEMSLPRRYEGLQGVCIVHCAVYSVQHCTLVQWTPYTDFSLEMEFPFFHCVQSFVICCVQSFVILCGVFQLTWCHANLYFTPGSLRLEFPSRIPIYSYSCFQNHPQPLWAKPSAPAFLNTLPIPPLKQVSIPVYLNIFPNDMMTAACGNQQTVLLPCRVGRWALGRDSENWIS